MQRSFVTLQYLYLRMLNFCRNVGTCYEYSDKVSHGKLYLNELVIENLSNENVPEAEEYSMRLNGTFRRFLLTLQNHFNESCFKHA